MSIASVPFLFPFLLLLSFHNFDRSLYMCLLLALTVQVCGKEVLPSLNTSGIFPQHKQLAGVPSSGHTSATTLIAGFWFQS